MNDKCQTPRCERDAAYDGHAYCSSCFAVVLRTGRPPTLEAKFEPEWLKRAKARPHGLARDETWRAA